MVILSLLLKHILYGPNANGTYQDPQILALWFWRSEYSRSFTKYVYGGSHLHFGHVTRTIEACLGYAP